MTISSSPAQRLAARVSIIGTDTPVRRALPHRQRHMIGAWCFLDHAGPVTFAPDQGLHVGAHPHIGLQTFTWMIEGEIIHRDSLGFEQVVRPGQVNIMTAGRGISHTEDSLTDGHTMHAAQLWIALPEEHRHREPAFHHHAQLPVVSQDGWQITVLVGSSCGQTSPVQVFSPLLGLDLTSAGAAATTLPLNTSFEHGVMVLRGQASIDGEPLGAEELLYLPAGNASLHIECAQACQLLVLGGQPFEQPVLLWWNFVARQQAELAQAVADWHAGSDRFGTVRPGSLGPRLVAPSLEGVHLKV